MSIRYRLIRPGQRLSRNLSDFRLNPNKLDALAQILHSSVANRNLSDIHRYYPLFVRESRQCVSNGPASQDRLDSLLNVLASSARPFDLSLVESILADLPTSFNVPLTPEIHTVILQALINHGEGNPQTVLNWLLSMPGKPGGFTPSRSQWHIYLDFCAARREYAGLLKAGIGVMKRAGCKPTNATFRIVLKGLLTEDVHIPDVMAVLAEMEGEGMKFDPPIAEVLFERINALFGLKKAKELADTYRSRFSFGVGTGNGEATINSQIEEESRKAGVKAAVALCKSLRNDGFSPSPHTLSVILRSAKSAEDVAFVESKLERKANVIHWSIVIGNVLRTGSVSNALAVYQASREAGIYPDAAMVQPLINALCHLGSSEDTDDSSVDRALELYNDLTQSSQDVSSRSRGPDHRTFQTLLRALASSSNIKASFLKATDLLSDMNRFSILPDSSIATSIIILYMRNSPSYDSAFSLYRTHSKDSKGVLLLDTKGFAAVLGAFCKLSFGKSGPIPPPQLYFEMVKDMRLAGCQMSAEVYTIFLRQIALLASQLPRRPPSEDTATNREAEHLRETLIATVRRAHNHLTLDPTLTPDTPLYNQLMDTYQRLGCLSEALRLFEVLMLSGQLDGASVSIVFDACGWAGNERVARGIFDKLVREGSASKQVMNVRNWNAWVECLCRLGKLSEATKVVCLEMGAGEAGSVVRPNEESVKILLAFASRVNREEEVRSKVKRYLPDLWDSLRGQYSKDW